MLFIFKFNFLPIYYQVDFLALWQSREAKEEKYPDMFFGYLFELTKIFLIKFWSSITNNTFFSNNLL